MRAPARVTLAFPNTRSTAHGPRILDLLGVLVESRLLRLPLVLGTDAQLVAKGLFDVVKLFLKLSLGAGASARLTVSSEAARPRRSGHARRVWTHETSSSERSLPGAANSSQVQISGQQFFVTFGCAGVRLLCSTLRVQNLGIGPDFRVPPPLGEAGGPATRSRSGAKLVFREASKKVACLARDCGPHSRQWPTSSPSLAASATLSNAPTRVHRFGHVAVRVRLPAFYHRLVPLNPFLLHVEQQALQLGRRRCGTICNRLALV